MLQLLKNHVYALLRIVVLPSLFQDADVAALERTNMDTDPVRCKPAHMDQSRETNLKGNTMPRKYIDCREYPSVMNCSVAVSADNDAELLEAAVQHAVAIHGHSDTPELRQQLKTLFKSGTPPVTVENSEA